MLTWMRIAGRRFGHLVAIEVVKSKGRRTTWKCQCDCGNIAYRNENNLIMGRAKSCGCVEGDRQQAYRHGMSGTRLYRIWSGIRTRCTNPNAPIYKYYGALGISVCDEWKDSPESFVAWANANGYRDDLTIDRIDVFGDYSPDNCRWVTMAEQAINRRNTLKVTYMGQTKPLATWCNEFGRPYKIVKGRMNRGWTFERAITEKVHESPRNKKS